jgi:hypothetical protein
MVPLSAHTSPSEYADRNLIFRHESKLCFAGLERNSPRRSFPVRRRDEDLGRGTVAGIRDSRQAGRREALEQKILRADFPLTAQSCCDQRG